MKSINEIIKDLEKASYDDINKIANDLFIEKRKKSKKSS